MGVTNIFIIYIFVIFILIYFCILQWVYNILNHKSETERIIFEDSDPETGFVLLPDIKWDGKQVESLYVCAIVQNRNIKSIRDLNEKHLPLLKNLLTKGLVISINSYLE